MHFAPGRNLSEFSALAQPLRNPSHVWKACRTFARRYPAGRDNPQNLTRGARPFKGLLLEPLRRAWRTALKDLSVVQ